MQMCGPTDNVKPKAENVRGLNIIKVLMVTRDTELNKNMGRRVRDLKICTEISPLLRVGFIFMLIIHNERIPVVVISKYQNRQRFDDTPRRVD